MDGWNGHVCSDPARNRYCIGAHSYPGDKIRDGRDLNWETSVAGQPCSKLNKLPPCIYSVNAFGRDTLTAFDDPPAFFPTGERAHWPLPPATVCVWPYEAMYDDGAKTDGRVDNDKRLVQTKAFFNEIENDKSLVFHYANYSNPFSEENANRYVVVGVSRVKKVGNIVFYGGTDEETKKKFGGAYVWQANVETYYPDQGFRIPYHRFMNDPNILEEITFYPDNPRCFKYGSRHVSDDDALSLVERFIEIASFLQNMSDTSENWAQRLKWLNSVVAEVWQSRGLYPGLARVFDLIGLGEMIGSLRTAVDTGGEKDLLDNVVVWLDGKTERLPVLLPKDEVSRIRRQWALRMEDERRLLIETVPRFDLPKEQIEKIISDQRSENGLDVDLEEIAVNPYLLSERFVGDDPDDVVPFSRIDHGVFPSPDLGGQFFCDPDDPRRLRALCVDRLKFETKHTFMPCGQMLQDVNHRLVTLPNWKRTEFTDRYLEVDRTTLEPAIVFRREGERDYAYLRSVYEAEREIEGHVRQLANLANIRFTSPVTESHWKDLLFDPQSPLVEKSRAEYEEAIVTQAAVCAQVFNRPVSVVCGAAGTGKTTIIDAILKAIEKAHGTQATFLLLAPTGKAADRIREKTGMAASTIHSFLAQHGWLNDNLTLKHSGGRQEEDVTTYVIDEASMLDLELTATLFRAIRSNSVQRVIFVGDPNQLPPIGRGRVFADIIGWLRENQPESVGELEVNLRQMENRVTGKGTGILDLAALYVRNSSLANSKDEDDRVRTERTFQRLQDLPSDGTVDKDLRLIYWNDADDLLDKLVERMVADMEEDKDLSFDPEAPHLLWLAGEHDDTHPMRADYHQVITPYRHEDFGTDAINQRIQREARGSSIDRIGQLASITLFDKVLQYRNRGASNPIWAYNSDAGENQQLNIFNGELGFVVPHGLDGRKWKSAYFRLSRFQVRFSRKEHLAVSYGEKLGYVTTNDRKRFLPKENPEDNLELAYAISVHKAQGSEFDRVYFVVPKEKMALLSPELFYTGITRATRHCTIFVQDDVAPLLRMRRPESSHLVGINSSLFDFAPVPDGFELIRREGFMEEYRIHQTLADYMVRSKSEVIIANILFDRDISFYYEKPLYAPDGSFYLPDFTIVYRGEQYYWEHLGMLESEEYRTHWELKKAWYEKHFPERLLTTEESGKLSFDAAQIAETVFN